MGKEWNCCLYIKGGENELKLNLIILVKPDNLQIEIFYEHFLFNLVVIIKKYITFASSKQMTHVMINLFFTYFSLYFYFSK